MNEKKDRPKMQKKMANSRFFCTERGKYAIIEKMKSIQICAVVQILANRFSAGSEKRKEMEKQWQTGNI